MISYALSIPIAFLVSTAMLLLNALPAAQPAPAPARVAPNQIICVEQLPVMPLLPATPTANLVRLVCFDGDGPFGQSDEKKDIAFFQRRGPGQEQVVEIKIDNGTIRATLNGEAIPAERVLEREGRIVILDEEGNELPAFMGLMMAPGEGAWWKMGKLDNQPFGAHAPRVMLGIHHDTPNPALEHHLGLEHGACTMITAVLEGLPAHQAGLREFDVVTAIDGTVPADPGTLLATIATREPGDVIRLDVVQTGKRRAVNVEIVAYDAERLADAAVLGSIPDRLLFGGPNVGAWIEGFGDRTRQLWTAPRVRDLLIDDENRIFEFEFDQDRTDDEPIDPSVPLPTNEWRGWLDRLHDAIAEERIDDENVNARLDRLQQQLDQLERLLDHIEGR